MLTKEKVIFCKGKGSKTLVDLINNYSGNKNLLFILKNIGRLPKKFDDTWVISLLSNSDYKIRLWLVKTLGKTGKKKNVKVLEKLAVEDKSSKVRCEAVSAIGRIRKKSVIPVLIKFLSDGDPKIVLQAIRGLLIFKEERVVKDVLKSFSEDSNPLIKEIVKSNFFNKSFSKCLNNKNSLDFPDYLKDKVIFGDVKAVIKHVADESFHLTFTSPPYYNARDYSIYRSYSEYLKFLNSVFKFVYKKTKEGRFIVVNSSPIIIPRISRQYSSNRYPIPFDLNNILIKMGWVFIDDIIWEKPEMSVKNRNGSFLQHRVPLGYKPNVVTEYLMVYRKKTDKLIDWNMKQYNKEQRIKSKVSDGYETSNIWKITPVHSKIHPAIFPKELCEKVVRYYSFKGDLVFDPFAGIGTLGKVAKNTGRHFFLVEKKKTYFNYMKKFFGGEVVLEENMLKNCFLSFSQFKRSI